MPTKLLANGEQFQTMTKKAAADIVQGLSNTSKMACKSYGLPAAECQVGSKLRLVPGSTCSDCYALKGNYVRYPAIVQAQYRRLESLKNPLWLPAMITLITGQVKFRWHDSGDLQSVEHLEMICEVARQTPGTKHWLPTREKAMVTKHARLFAVPENLVIRVSAAMIDGNAPASANTSTVHTNLFNLVGNACIAPDQAGECRDCMMCWDKSVANVSYKKH